MKYQSCPSLLNTDKWDLLWLCWRGGSKGLGDRVPESPSSCQQAHTALPPHPRHSRSARAALTQALLICSRSPLLPSQALLLHHSLHHPCTPLQPLASFLHVQLCSIPSPLPRSPSSALAQCFMPGLFLVMTLIHSPETVRL